MSLPTVPESEGRRVLHVCGYPGAGKTRWLLTRAETLRARGLQVGGFVQPAVPGEGWNEGYDLLDLATGERISFVRRSPADPVSGRQEYTFEPAAWAWAAERIRVARLEADVLLVDECGRLEAGGGGHLPALLAPVPQERCRRWILAVRREVLLPLRARLGLPVATVRLPGGIPRLGRLSA